MVGDPDSGRGPAFRPRPTESINQQDHVELRPDRDLSAPAKFALTVLGGLGLLAILLVVAVLVLAAFLAYSWAGSSQGTGDQAEPLADSVTFSQCETVLPDPEADSNPNSGVPGTIGMATLEFTNPEDGTEIANIAIRVLVTDHLDDELLDDTWLFRGVSPGETVSQSVEFPGRGESPQPLQCEVALITVKNS